MTMTKTKTTASKRTTGGHGMIVLSFVFLCSVIIIVVEYHTTKKPWNSSSSNCYATSTLPGEKTTVKTRSSSSSGSSIDHADTYRCPDSSYREDPDWRRLYCGSTDKEGFSSSSPSSAVTIFQNELSSSSSSSSSSWTTSIFSGSAFPKYEACFVTSIFGTNATNVDWLWDARRFVERFPNHGFFLWTNLVDFEVPDGGWQKVLFFDSQYKRMITQSRYPKFMAWQHDFIRKSCPVVYYVDVSADPDTITHIQLSHQTMITKRSQDGLSQLKHRWGVMEELQAIVDKKKDVRSNIDKTRHWLKSQPDFSDECQLYENTYFAYDPNNKRFQQAATFFWQHYSNEQDSWRDQPLWCYVLDRFNMKPAGLERNMFRVDMSRYGGRLGTHIYDEETNVEGQIFYESMRQCCDSSDDDEEYSDNVDVTSDWTTSTYKKYPWDVCEPVTDEDKTFLKKEIADYEKSKRFVDKLKEVRGEVKVAAHHAAIDKFLKEKVLRPGWSILELGCAAGAMLQMVQRTYDGGSTNGGNGIGQHKELVGVELVTGWVKFAQDYFEDKSIDVFEGDITEFNLPPPYDKKTFDFVMLNDVAEHIQKHRYGCFFHKLREVTHEGSLVYFHTPNPQTQLADAEQFFENVLPHHVVVSGMAASNFELVMFEQDVDTMCGRGLSGTSPSAGAAGVDGFPKAILNTKCSHNGYTKYYHAVFRRVDSKPIFDIS